MFTMNEAAYGRRSYADKLSYTAGRHAALHAWAAPKRVGDPGPSIPKSGADAADDRAPQGAESVLHRRSIAPSGSSADMKAHGGLLSTDDLAGVPRARTQAAGDHLSRPSRRGAAAAARAGSSSSRCCASSSASTSPRSAQQSRVYPRCMAEAMKIAGRDKEIHIGDPDFVPPPLEMLLSDAYADACAARRSSVGREDLPAARRRRCQAHRRRSSCVDGDGHGGLAHPHASARLRRMPPGHGFMLDGAMNWYDPRPAARARSRRASGVSPR
jgi:gamma-glutamyltranspeptidase/glutathione hydrolase